MNSREIKKQLSKKIQQLLNENYESKKLNVKIGYESCFSNTETSLLIENR